MISSLRNLVTHLSITVAVYAHMKVSMLPNPEWLINLSWVPILAAFIVQFCHGCLFSIIIILQNEVFSTDIRYKQNHLSMIAVILCTCTWFSLKEYLCWNSWRSCRNGICSDRENIPHARCLLDLPWDILCLCRNSAYPHHLGCNDN